MKTTTTQGQRDDFKQVKCLKIETVTTTFEQEKGFLGLRKPTGVENDLSSHTLNINIIRARKLSMLCFNVKLVKREFKKRRRRRHEKTNI